MSTDVISEILLRIPEKSIVRFRCVSKFWLSITTDLYFIKLFETRNPRPTSLLICYKEEDELVVSSIPQHSLSLDQNSINSYSYSRPTHTYRMKFPEDCWFFTDSVHGLICFQTLTEVIVWNPNTSKFLTLPTPFKSNITTFLGYDLVEAKHKVIAVHSRRTCTVCMVITLGSGQESWRIVKTNQKHTPYYLSNAFGQCIKGVIYYLASTYDQDVWVIMRFDVKSEKLDTIQLPSDIQVDRLITYEEKLACVYIKDSTEESGFTLLILEDAEENKWSSKDFLAPFYHHRNQSLQIDFQLRGFTHASEFMYEPYSLYEYRNSLNVLFFDPVRNSFRRVGFKGIAEDEESRGWFHIFPNHIESQMSL